MSEFSRSKNINQVITRSAALVLGISLVLLLGTCTSVTKPIPVPQTIKALQGEEIMGVTTREGEWINFDSETAAVVTVQEGAEGPIVIQATVDGAPYETELSDVQRIWVTRKEMSKGGAATVLAIGTIILLAILIDDDEEEETNTSCPFVYSWNGSEFVMDAEPYGGATTRGLERDDYSELENLVAEDGYYRLLVRNELKETQYTDLLELIVVDHPAGQRVIADEWGRFHTVSDTKAPIVARDHLGNDLRHWLVEKDKKIWETLPVADAEGNVRTEIVLSFPKPRGATQARLVANVATGSWGASMVKAMLELHGRDLDAWYTLIDSEPVAPELIQQWNLREELYALQVHVEEPTGWKLAGVLPGGGPFAVEDRIVPLDVSRVTGEEVRIRIRPPVGFWALDWLAMDYSEDTELSVQTVRVEAAQDDLGQDVREHLIAADGVYHKMPRVGNEFSVSIPAPASEAGVERTVFLHSRGHYRLHLDGEGEPNITLLQEIEKVPDRAARFAVQRFQEFRDRVIAAAAQP